MQSSNKGKSKNSKKNKALQHNQPASQTASSVSGHVQQQVDTLYTQLDALNKIRDKELTQTQTSPTKIKPGAVQ